MVFVLVVAGAGTLACASAPKAPLFVVDQEELESAVAERLASDDRLAAAAIVVEVERGAVRLTGTVPTEDQRRRAAALALQTRGVRAVINRLDVADARSVVAEGVGD